MADISEICKHVATLSRIEQAAPASTENTLPYMAIPPPVTENTRTWPSPRYIFISNAPPIFGNFFWQYRPNKMWGKRKNKRMKES